MLLLLLFYLFKYNIYAYNETQYKMSACSAKIRLLGTNDEVQNTIKVLECEIAEVKLVAEDAANGHPILHFAVCKAIDVQRNVTNDIRRSVLTECNYAQSGDISFRRKQE